MAHVAVISSRAVLGTCHDAVGQESSSCSEIGHCRNANVVFRSFDFEFDLRKVSVTQRSSHRHIRVGDEHTIRDKLAALISPCALFEVVEQCSVRPTHPRHRPHDCHYVVRPVLALSFLHRSFQKSAFLSHEFDVGPSGKSRSF